MAKTGTKKDNLLEILINDIFKKKVEKKDYPKYANKQWKLAYTKNSDFFPEKIAFTIEDKKISFLDKENNSEFAVITKINPISQSISDTFVPQLFTVIPTTFFPSLFLGIATGNNFLYAAIASFTDLSIFYISTIVRKYKKYRRQHPNRQFVDICKKIISHLLKERWLSELGAYTFGLTLLTTYNLGIENNAIATFLGDWNLYIVYASITAYTISRNKGGGDLAMSITSSKK